MATFRKAIPSRQLLLAIFHSRSTPSCPCALVSYSHSHFRRHASTTNPPKSSKPIVLEQPDKFRPPSHPQRLPRKPPRQYPGPPLSSTEREHQRTKRYPHTFPNEGTIMYRFLTNKWLHVWITIGFLTVLSTITLTQSFIKTSPFAHLLPSVSSLPLHPITFFKEWMSVYRMHMEYKSEQVDRMRHQGVLDAQYRRLYRRAHGMENLDVEEDSGIDVRGLVPWDDGLTNRERERGTGRKAIRTGFQVLEEGGRVGDPLTKEREGESEKQVKLEEQQVESAREVLGKPSRKVKRWLGIWE